MQQAQMKMAAGELRLLIVRCGTWRRACVPPVAIVHDRVIYSDYRRLRCLNRHSNIIHGEIPQHSVTPKSLLNEQPVNNP